AAGYVFSGSWTWGENIAWATTRSPTGYQDEVQLLHTNLMNSSGHRANLLNDSFHEIGLGFEVGEYSGRESAFLTEDFARSGSAVFLTGVAFDDRDGDRFYDPGEDLGGLTVTAVSSAGARYTTTTLDAGGYDLALPAGTYSVTFAGSGIATTTMQATIGSKNVKLDLIDPGTGGSAGGFDIVGADDNNYLSGCAGDDRIDGRGGDDVIDGGPGNDTALYSGPRSAYEISWKDGGASVSSSADGHDRLINVEAVQFADRVEHITTRPLDYIASYADLSNALGADPIRGFDHYLKTGFQEGRSVAFSGLEYIASYADLIAALGANGEAGAAHYITSGRFEGRLVAFDGLEYIASYGDLISAFGANSDAGAAHYITNGRFEGRLATFDGLEYIASYGDLIGAFGANSDAGAVHYITAGRFEGRLATFDGLEYIASYGDLISAFGANSDRGALHFIANGFGEGRSMSFDPVQYLANYADLRAAFGNNYEAATVHYITNGFAESRTDEPI
ncbi:MAG: hypothetical protein WCA12_06365, partial [Burkholderiales bacterium]